VLEIAVGNTDRLVLINDILDIERIESGKVSMVKQTCDAANLMLQSADAMRVMADKAGVFISFSLISPAVGRPRPDYSNPNLLSNAIKFSRGVYSLLTAELGNWGLL